MKLYIKQKVFSWRDRFSVCDGRSEPCYTVEGEIFTWGRKLHIRDMAERELAFHYGMPEGSGRHAAASGRGDDEPSSVVA